MTAPQPSAPAPVARVALVGDRSPAVKAHSKIPALMDALALASGAPIELYWLHSRAVGDAGDLGGFDGVWVVPGSPYENSDGVITAIETARTRGIPFLGTCGGFQYMLIEFARNVCGIEGATSAEVGAVAGAPVVIVELACSLLGEEATVLIEPGSVAAGAMGAGPTTERFFCRYGLNDRYVPTLTDHGLLFSGRDERGEARVAELPGHPYFVGALFQPELSSDPTWVHPLIAAFGRAVHAHAGSTLAPT